MPLQASFRASANIQRAVNAAFASVMTGRSGDAAGGLHAASEGSRRPAGAALGRRASRAAAVRTHQACDGHAIEDSLPDAVGAFVAWLVNESKWRSPNATGEPAVPLEARHICLLFRRFTSWQNDMTRPYVQALEARGVPHLLVGGKQFHDREEVEMLASR